MLLLTVCAAHFYLLLLLKTEHENVHIILYSLSLHCHISLLYYFLLPSGESSLWFNVTASPNKGSPWRPKHDKDAKTSSLTTIIFIFPQLNHI